MQPCQYCHRSIDRAVKPWCVANSPLGPELGGCCQYKVLNHAEHATLAGKCIYSTWTHRRSVAETELRQHGSESSMFCSEILMRA